ncbi:MAG: hypothetical protein RR565_07490 [Erysipelothrix sp.]
MKHKNKMMICIVLLLVLSLIGLGITKIFLLNINGLDLNMMAPEVYDSGWFAYKHIKFIFDIAILANIIALGILLYSIFIDRK